MSCDLRRFRLVESLEARLGELEDRLQRLQDVSDPTADELPVASGLATAERAPRAEVVRYHGMLTRSEVMNELFALIERIKDADLRTLIVGETGTGKELVARAIHYGGHRASEPFEVIACGSLSTDLLESELFGYRKGAFSGAEHDKKGIFEQAEGGTVFLDEVTDMPPEMQQKILRVLQEKVVRPIGADSTVSIEVRIVSSTREDLEHFVQEKKFRKPGTHILFTTRKLSKYSLSLVPGNAVVEEIASRDYFLLRHTTTPHNHVPRIDLPGGSVAHFHHPAYPRYQVIF